MLKQLFEDYQKNLAPFFEDLDIKKAEEIFHLLLNTKGTLVFSGVGKSGIIAEKLAMTMISTGTKALYLPAMNALHGDIGALSADDILICISKSGESEELLELIPFARERGAKTIAWVSNESSKLFIQCDKAICLPFRREVCPFDLAPTTSTAIQLIFGDVLAVALMRAKKFSLDQYALNHPAGLIGKKVTLKVDDLMLSGDKLPVCRPSDLLETVLSEFSAKRCGCVLVTNANGQLEGIFTDGDLRRALHIHPKEILKKEMRELMTPSFFSTNSGEYAFEALKQMQQDPKRFVTTMPVLKGKRLVGLIRMHDIVQAGIS